tara:strand:+ start:3116 stop:3493 length:378 start_codon:yes stop_codon:yes gene_type:complete
MNPVSIDNNECLADIKSLTGEAFLTLDPDFVEHLLESVHSTPVVWKLTVDAHNDAAITKQVIGTQGYYLRLTTNNTKCYFIWHDRLANVFHFWGGHDEVKLAAGIISSRIRKIVFRNTPPMTVEL